jgi:helicase-like protein
MTALAQIAEAEEVDLVKLDPVVETEDERKTRLSVYHEIKRLLMTGGIPEHEIAFVHDYDGPAAMAELSRKLNAGEIRIVLASTTKLGIGANIQSCLYAIHHGDPPWVPSWIEQRNGRALRFGNIYPEVHICIYVTEGSFDAYIWQLLESKTRFISQVMRGELTARTVEDIDIAVLNASQIKAIASGNPLVIEKVGLETELTRLDRLYTTWNTGRNALRQELAGLPNNLANAEADWRNQVEAVEIWNRNIPGDADAGKRNFEIKLRPNATSHELIAFTQRELAGAQIRHLAPALQQAALKSGRATLLLGEYAGFNVYATATCRNMAEDLLTNRLVETWLYLKLKDRSAEYGFNLTESDAGIIQSMDARLRGLGKLRDQAEAVYRRLLNRKDKIEIELAKGWEYAEKFKELSARLKVLNASMRTEGVDVEEPPYLSELSADAFLPSAPESLVSKIEPAVEPVESTTIGQNLGSPTEPEVPRSSEDFVEIPVSPESTLDQQGPELLIEIAAPSVMENSAQDSPAIETQWKKEKTDWDELFARREQVKAERANQPRSSRRNSSLLKNQKSFDWS